MAEQANRVEHRLYLLYHELRPATSQYSYVVEPAVFERQVEVFLRLRTASGARLWPEITFDDGHLSNFEFALPILQSSNLQARFFITVGWTGKKPGYMGWQELRSLHQAGQLIGAHGWTHTLLTHCTEEQLKLELGDARLALEDNLGAAVTTMSLPGGRYNRRVLAACEEAGYTEVYCSIPRVEAKPRGLLIGRLNIRRDMSQAWIAGLFEPGSRELLRLGRQYRVKAAAKAMLGDTAYEKVWALLNRKERDTE